MDNRSTLLIYTSIILSLAVRQAIGDESSNTTGCLPAGTNIAERLKELIDATQDDTTVDVSTPLLVDPIYGPVEDWCFDLPVDFSGAFQGMTDIPWDITGWNTSGIEDFNSVFDGCTNFNQNISRWDTSNAKNFSYMFRNAKSFNQEIGWWTVSSVVDFTEMFRGASSFTGGLGLDYIRALNSINHCFCDDTRCHNTTECDEFYPVPCYCGVIRNCPLNFTTEYDLYASCRQEVFRGNWFTNSGEKYDRMFQGATSFDGNTYGDSFDFRGATYADIYTETKYEIVNNYPACSFDVNVSYFPEIDDLTLPRVLASLSMLSSLYIIYGLIGRQRDREKNMKFWFHRMLLGVSCFDVTSSLGFFLMDWPMPSEYPVTYREGGPPAITPNDYNSDPFVCYKLLEYLNNFPGASGNVTTCTIQGFIIQVGTIGSMLFTCWLSLGFLLMVKYNWREQNLEKLQRILVSFTLLLAFGSAIFLAAIGQFNYTTPGFCWIGPFPPNFEYDGVPYDGYSEDEKVFLRGTENYFIYRLVFGQVWVGVALLIIMYSLIVVFCHVRSTVARNRRYGAAHLRREMSASRSSSLRGSFRGELLSEKEKLVMKKGFSYSGK